MLWLPSCRHNCIILWDLDTYDWFINVHSWTTLNIYEPLQKENTPQQLHFLDILFQWFNNFMPICTNCLCCKKIWVWFAVMLMVVYTNTVTFVWPVAGQSHAMNLAACPEYSCSAPSVLYFVPTKVQKHGHSNALDTQNPQSEVQKRWHKYTIYNSFFIFDSDMEQCKAVNQASKVKLSNIIFWTFIMKYSVLWCTVLWVNFTWCS